ncbi:MAG: bacillithiol system redox-active protein YtxJ [Planctomycetes bacterium]|nr:bacillithiol system redox-active protein YtxJ [Planctomycetota bacterium]
MSETVVRDLPTFDNALKQPRVLLFKHSPICPISSAARAEYELFRLDHPDAPTLFVDVIGARAVSRAIAEQCGVQHQSPQAILFVEGKATWNASHDAITAGALDAAWAPSC